MREGGRFFAILCGRPLWTPPYMIFPDQKLISDLRILVGHVEVSTQLFENNFKRTRGSNLLKLLRINYEQWQTQ